MSVDGVGYHVRPVAVNVDRDRRRDQLLWGLRDAASLRTYLKTVTQYKCRMCTYLNKASEGRLLFCEETFTRIAVQAVTSDQEAARVGLPVSEGDGNGVRRFFEGKELVAEDDWDTILLGVL